jgi:hypothetical protein
VQQHIATYFIKTDQEKTDVLKNIADSTLKDRKFKLSLEFPALAEASGRLIRLKRIYNF